MLIWENQLPCMPVAMRAPVPDGKHSQDLEPRIFQALQPIRAYQSTRVAQYLQLVLGSRSQVPQFSLAALVALRRAFGGSMVALRWPQDLIGGPTDIQILITKTIIYGKLIQSNISRRKLSTLCVSSSCQFFK